MWAMAMKEFRQMRRDRRTLAMMILLPVLLLVVFGYAASFDVDQVKTVVVGPRAQQLADALPDRLEVVRVAPARAARPPSRPCATPTRRWRWSPATPGSRRCWSTGPTCSRPARW